MADSKISALTSVSLPLDGSEQIPVVQSSTTKKATINNLTQKPYSLFGTGNDYLSAYGYPANDKYGIGVNYYNNSGTNTVPTLARCSFKFEVDNAGGKYATIAYRDAGAAASAFTDYFKVFSTGDTAFYTGNLVQGTANKGVNFTANTPAAGMTSQLLNWYEEGTWTPTLQTDGTNFSAVTYNAVRGGRYIRIGKIVHIQGWFYTDSITVGSASGNLVIGGLPFTVSANSGSSQLGRSAINVSYCVAWGATFPSAGIIESNSTLISLYYRSAADGATSAVPYTSAGTGAAANRIGFSGTYVCA